MPAYYHDTPIDVPDNTWVRFDSDSNGTPAVVFNRSGQPIVNSVVLSVTGLVPRVTSDAATLFLRLATVAGVATSGVVTQTSGVAFTSFDSDPDITSRAAATTTGLSKAVADAAYAPAATAVVAQQALTLAQSGGSGGVSAPQSALLDSLSTSLAQHARYAYSTYYLGQGYPAAPSYIEFPNATEVSIRYPGSWGVGMAAAVASGVFSRKSLTANGGASLVGPQLRAAAAQIGTSLVRAHASNHDAAGSTGAAWGVNDPQSGYWCASAGFIYLLDPSAWSQTEVGWLKRATAAEADYTVSLRASGQTWRTRANGPSDSPVVAGSGAGNGRAEESSWNAQTCAMALALNPEHANAQAWADCLIVNALHGFARWEDLSDSSVVNGKTLSQVLTGYNLMSNGFIPNHGVAHPDYVGAAINQFYFTMLALALSNKPAPRALRRNMERPFTAFVDFPWLTSAGFQNPTSVTMLATPRGGWPGGSQRCLPRDANGNLVTDVYYPEQDAGRTAGAPYMTTKGIMALAADHLGMDATTTVKAVTMAQMYLGWTLDRQGRTVAASNNFGAVTLPSGAAGRDTEDIQGEPEPNVSRSLGLATIALQRRLAGTSQLGTLVDDTSAQLAARYVSIGGGAPAPAPDTTPPTAQTFTATPGNGQVVLNGSATDNVGVTGWRVVRTVGSTTTTLGGGSVTLPFTDTGLTNGTAVSYTGQALDAAGNASNTLSAGPVTPAVPSDTTPPSTPGTPTATGQVGGIALAWTASTDNVAVQNYRVYRSDNPSTVIGSPTSNSYTDTTAPAGTSFTYTVDAVDAAGNASGKSASSNSASATTAGPTPVVRDTYTDTAGKTLTNHTPDIGAQWVTPSTAGTGPTITSDGCIRAAVTTGAGIKQLPTTIPLGSYRLFAMPVKTIASLFRIYAQANTTDQTAMRLTVDCTDNATFKFTLVRTSSTGGNTTVAGPLTMSSPPVAGGMLYLRWLVGTDGRSKIWASASGFPDGTGTPIIDGSSDASPITVAGFLGVLAQGGVAGDLADGVGLQMTSVEAYSP